MNDLPKRMFLHLQNVIVTLMGRVIDLGHWLLTHLEERFQDGGIKHLIRGFFL